MSLPQRFKPGGPGGPGRGAGVKNRLSRRVVEDIYADWMEGGAAAIKITRMEQPATYFKIIAGLLPKEVLLGTAVSDYDDATLERLAEDLVRQIEQQEPMKLIEAKAVEHEEH
jgi:hypothetical protein